MFPRVNLSEEGGAEECTLDSSKARGEHYENKLSSRRRSFERRVRARMN